MNDVYPKRRLITSQNLVFEALLARDMSSMHSLNPVLSDFLLQACKKVFAAVYVVSAGIAQWVERLTMGCTVPEVVSRCGGRDFPHLSRPALEPTQPSVQWVPGLSPGVKSGRGVTLAPDPLLVPLVMKE